MAAKIPKGIGPVFLTGNTCERFKIRPDVELSAQKPCVRAPHTLTLFVHICVWLMLRMLALLLFVRVV